MRSRWFVAFALLALTPAASGGEDDARLAQVAETYGVAAWPAATARRAGVSPQRVDAKGYTRGDVRVDPRVGEGRVSFKSERGGEVVLTLRVFEEAKAARAALVGRLATVQGVLARQPGAGEVAFGARDAKGRTSLLVAVRGNVTFELRATRPEGLSADAIEALALAADGAILEARPLEPGVPLPAPRVLAVRVAAARAGQPAALTLDVDPAGPAAVYASFTCGEGAGVVQTDGGFELLAPRAGTLHIDVCVASQELLVSRAKATIEVADE